MEKEDKNGGKEQNGMVTNMKVNFSMGLEKDGGNIFTEMVTYMRASGKTEIKMKMGLTILLMGMFTGESGRKE